MSEIVTYINDEYKKLWAQKPEELGNIFKRNEKGGKHFSVWVNSYVYIEEINTQIYRIANWTKAEKGDLETLKMLAADVCKAGAGNFRVSFGMTEFADMLLKVADGFAACTSYKEVEDIARALHLYTVRMWYYIDGLNPWAKLSDYFNELKGL